MKIFCTNSGCQSRLNLILNLKTAQIDHLNWIEFQLKISRPHICSCSQPICLKFGLPLNNNLVKHPEKYGNNNRCISTNNLTVNPKNMPKFIIFYFLYSIFVHTIDLHGQNLDCILATTWRYGSIGNRCLSRLNLNLNKKIRPKFITFFIFQKT